MGVLAAGMATVAAHAADEAGTLLVVETDRPATCTIDKVVSGRAPLISRVAPGNHEITCVATLNRVTVRRSTTASVASGQHALVRVVILGRPSR